MLANSSPPRWQITEIPQAAERAFRSIADHETFRVAPVMRALLVYLWEHQGESLSEYAVAVDALGRSPSFDPKTDASVRVQIARLRAKLKEFYDDEPSGPLRLDVPRGTHDLRWTFEAPSRSVLDDFWGMPKVFRVLLCALTAVVVILVGISLNLSLANRSLRAAAPPSPRELPRFWQSFLSNAKRPMIVVPSPVYFMWPEKNILVRDFNVSEFPQWPKSPFLRELAGKWGQPTLYQTYVSLLDMEAAVKLEQYLQNAGERPEIFASRRLAADSTEGRNTIFMGVPRTSSHLKDVLEKTPLYLDSLTPEVVRSRISNAEYREVAYSADHKIYPEILAYLPPTADGSRTLLLLGIYPAALAYMLESQDGLKSLDQAWNGAGRPDSWEMVVNAEMNGAAVVKASAVTVVRLAADFWKK